jgi:hypothetical protein
MQQLFPQGAVDSFYPTFPEIEDTSQAKLIDLVTLSRGMSSNPPAASQQFLNDVARLFNYVSGQAVSNTLYGGKFSPPKKGTLEGIPLASGAGLTSGEMGTITDSAGLATGVKYKPNASYRADSWPMSWLPSDLARKAMDLDVMKSMLSPSQKGWYRLNQVEAQRNALTKGRNILMGNLNAKDERSQGGKYGGARIGDRVRYASGGSVFTPRGTDTVPAMLTPGEFVMKKSAVDKYGTGFMSAINNGVQRFATGGPVQYLQGGSQKPVASGSGGGFFGGVGDIVSAISDSLSAFTTAFSLFSGLSSLLSNTINGMAEMHITHTIILQGSLSIPGFAQEDIDGIIMNISKGVVNGVDEKIKIAFDQRDLDNENK